MATTTKAVEVTGTVERCKVEERAPFRRNYYSPCEQSEIYLDVALRLDDGSTVYFKTPAARKSIASAPGVAILMYWIENGAKDWLVERGVEDGEGSRCATPDKSNTNRIEPTLRIGDRITVRGSLKADAVSRKGNAYKVLTRVRRVV